MDIAKGKYWDLAVNPIIIDDCSCEVGDRCWAKQMINRGLPNIKPGWFPERLNIDKISLRGKSQVYAVNWLCDIAHKNVDTAHIRHTFFKLMYHNHWRIGTFNKKPHTFLILTKYPERLYKEFSECNFNENSTTKDGIWIGTSITGANEKPDWDRLAALMKFKGFKLWVSAEPSLGFVPQLKRYLPDISQVIAGAETGSGARPCDLKWLRAIRDDCKDAGVSFFLKQKDKNRNRVLDERTHDRLEWE